MTLNRRNFIKTTGACFGAAAAISTPGVSFAGSVGDKKLVVIYLYGGADQLTLFPAYGDPDYVNYRGPIAVPAPGAKNLPNGQAASLYMSDLFSMHPNMPEMYGMFARGELTAFMNVGLCRDAENLGSHFNEMHRPHNGLNIADNSHLGKSGWVNRLLEMLDGENVPGAIAVTSSPVLPDTMRGSELTAIYAPPGIPTDRVTMQRLQDTLGNRPLGRILQTAQSRRDSINQTLSGNNIDFRNYSSFWGSHIQAKVAGLVLGSNNQYTPSIAVMGIDGWDWHSGQVGSYPASRAAHLSLTLGTLVDTLKARNVFDKTLIVVVSEFGRAIALNGQGTDHGNGQTGMIVTGNPLLMATPARGVVLNGAWRGLKSKNSTNNILVNDNFMNIIREYVRAHFNLTQQEIDYVIPFIRMN